MMRLTFTIIALFLLSYFPTTVTADIYSYKDNDGVVHLSNTPKSRSRKKSKRVYKEMPATAGSPMTMTEKDSVIQTINRIARSEGVDPALARAIARAESSYNPRAVSPKGAIGVMQLMPGTADRYNVKDIYKVEDNVRGGIQYLRYLIGLFPQDKKLAIASYNAGENRVLRTGTIPNFKETKEYVERVIRIYNQSGSDTISRPVRKYIDDKGNLHFSNL